MKKNVDIAKLSDEELIQYVESGNAGIRNRMALNHLLLAGTDEQKKKGLKMLRSAILAGKDFVFIYIEPEGVEGLNKNNQNNYRRGYQMFIE